MQGSCRKTCQTLPPTRSPSCGVLIASLSPHRRVDAFKVGPKAVVVADCDLRGDITLGPGTVGQSVRRQIRILGPLTSPSPGDRHDPPTEVYDPRRFRSHHLWREQHC